MNGMLGRHTHTHTHTHTLTYWHRLSVSPRTHKHSLTLTLTQPLTYRHKHTTHTLSYTQEGNRQITHTYTRCAHTDTQERNRKVRRGAPLANIKGWKFFVHRVCNVISHLTLIYMHTHVTLIYMHTHRNATDRLDGVPRWPIRRGGTMSRIECVLMWLCPTAWSPQSHMNPHVVYMCVCVYMAGKGRA